MHFCISQIGNRWRRGTCITHIVTVCLDQLTRIIISMKYHRLFLFTLVTHNTFIIKCDCSQCLKNDNGQCIMYKVCMSEYYHIIYPLFFILHLALDIFLSFTLYTAQNVHIIRRLKKMINMLYYFVSRIFEFIV